MSDAAPTDDTTGSTTEEPAGETTTTETDSEAPPAGGTGDETSADAADKGTESAESDATKSGAPESYQPFKLPDGFGLSEDYTGKLHEWLSRNGVSQDEAQGLIDMSIELRKAQDADREQTTKADLEKQSAEWRDAVKSDEEMGGANTKVADAAIERALSSEALGGPALREAMKRAELDQLPEFKRFAYRVGKAMTSDTFGGSKPARREPTREDKFVPNAAELGLKAS